MAFIDTVSTWRKEYGINEEIAFWISEHSGRFRKEKDGEIFECPIGTFWWHGSKWNKPGYYLVQQVCIKQGIDIKDVKDENETAKPVYDEIQQLSATFANLTFRVNTKEGSTEMDNALQKLQEFKALKAKERHNEVSKQHYERNREKISERRKRKYAEKKAAQAMAELMNK